MIYTSILFTRSYKNFGHFVYQGHKGKRPDDLHMFYVPYVHLVFNCVHFLCTLRISLLKYMPSFFTCLTRLFFMPFTCFTAISFSGAFFVSLNDQDKQILHRHITMKNHVRNVAALMCIGRLRELQRSCQQMVVSLFFFFP